MRRRVAVKDNGYAAHSLPADEADFNAGRVRLEGDDEAMPASMNRRRRFVDWVGRGLAEAAG
jgi:hypothetical protein